MCVYEYVFYSYVCTVQDSLAAATFACAVLRSMARRGKTTEDAARLEEAAQSFEALAVALLSQCLETDATFAELLLIRAVPGLGGRTALQMARSAGALKLLAHPACQRLLDRVWHGHMIDSAVTGAGIARALVFPPALLSLPFYSSTIDHLVFESNISYVYI